jgi:hypothetical protein
VASPGNRAVELALGGRLLPVATLGPGEVIPSSLLGGESGKWCLQPISSRLELMVLPRVTAQQQLEPTTSGVGFSADRVL